MASTPQASRPTPSPAAVSRLRVGLDDQVAAMSRDIDTDLDDIDRALADEREDVALDVLRAHIARLDAFAEQVRRTVAGSMVEREAEAVVDAVVATVPPPPGPAAGPPPRTGVGSGVGAVVRRGLLAAACVAVAAVIVGPGKPSLPSDPLSAALTASEQALIAAEGVTPGSPTSLAELGARNAELHRAIAQLDRRVLADPWVRIRLEALLAEQQQALWVLAQHSPEAGILLADLQRLAAALDLRLPAPIQPAVPVVPVDVALPDSGVDQPPVTAGSATGAVGTALPATPPPPEASGAEPAPVPEQAPAGDPGEDAAAAPDPAPADEPSSDQPAGDDGDPATDEDGADTEDPSAPPDIESLLQEDASLDAAANGLSGLSGD